MCRCNLGVRLIKLSTLNFLTVIFNIVSYESSTFYVK